MNKIKGTAKSVCNDCYDDGFKGFPCPHIEVVDKTEQIREEFLKTHLGCPCHDGESCGCEYREEISDWWIQKLEEQKQEAHEANNGWCCACDYDQIELNRRLEEQKQVLMGVSQWREYGKKMGYEDYWKGRYAVELMEEIEKLKLPIHNVVLGSNEDNIITNTNRIINTVLSVIKDLK